MQSDILEYTINQSRWHPNKYSNNSLGVKIKETEVCKTQEIESKEQNGRF